MITVYTKNGCMQCQMTKKELIKRGIEFNEINLDEQPEYIEHVKKLGYSTVPVIQTDQEIWSGFQPTKLRSLA